MITPRIHINPTLILNFGNRRKFIWNVGGFVLDEHLFCH
jgi:hypothetical protein